MVTPDADLVDDEGDLVEEELVPLVPGQTEDESDFEEEPAPSGRFRASVAARDWTVETLVNQMRKGRIDLDPAFQRRNAWLGNRKSRLIESILIGYPIPQVVLAENKDRPGTYFVLDGKQRLLALRQFFAEPSEERDAGFTPLHLEQLEILSHLNRSSVGMLEAEHPDLFATLENYTIRTVVLSEWNSESLLLSLFLRLNTGSLTLSPQELRQALIPGSFIRWLDGTSGTLESLRLLLGNRHPDRRMVDAELLLRYLAFGVNPVRYRGNLKAFLDDTCRQFNSTWLFSEPIVTAATVSMELALEAAQIIFRGTPCRKWTRDHYERAVNRAVFDVLTYSLSFDNVRDSSLEQPSAVEQAFKQLCSTSAAFTGSITSTTKTANSFRTRHDQWRQALTTVTGVDYPLPPALAAD